MEFEASMKNINSLMMQKIVKSKTEIINHDNNIKCGYQHGNQYSSKC